MTKAINGIIGVITAIGLVLVLSCGAIFIVSFGDINWFRKEYKKYNVYETIKISAEDLDGVTIQMNDFLMGKRADLNNINAEIDGTNREFFNDVEKIHMDDVRVIFDTIRLMGMIGGALTVLGFIYFLVLEIKGNGAGLLLGIPLCIAGVGMIVIMAIMGLLISSSFSDIFITFHEVLFTNDFWLLDPDTSLLISIVPEGFFFDTAAKMAIVLFICYLAVFVLGLVICITKRRRKATLHFR